MCVWCVCMCVFRSFVALASHVKASQIVTTRLLFSLACSGWQQRTLEATCPLWGSFSVACRFPSQGARYEIVFMVWRQLSQLINCLIQHAIHYLFVTQGYVYKNTSSWLIWAIMFAFRQKGNWYFVYDIFKCISLMKMYRFWVKCLFQKVLWQILQFVSGNGLVPSSLQASAWHEVGHAPGALLHFL